MSNVRWSHRSGLGCDPVALHGAPISFTSVYEGLLPGQTVVLDQSALANGYRAPYWLDEIRMQSVMGAASATALYPGFATQFQFRTHSCSFSQTHIPMMLYQPQYVNDASLQTQIAQPPLYALYSDTTVKYGASARWLFPKPLFMPAASILTVSVRRSSVVAIGDGSVPFTVAVTYVGRTLPPGAKAPAVKNVPWIAEFTHDFANLYSQTDVQSRFRNPFTSELNVYRWIGRPFSNAGSGVTDFLPFRNNMIPDDAGTKYAAIDIWDSTGYRVTHPGGANGNYTPVGHVFDTERCVWAFNRPLGPREQYNMAFQTLGSVGGTNKVFSVAMHAHREEIY